VESSLFVFWRPKNGKFRWVLKDLDFGFGLDRGFSGDTAANTVFYMLNPGVNSSAWAYNEINTFFFRRVLSDKDSIIKQLFTDYYLVTLGDLLRENVITTMIDSFAGNIHTEYPYHADRWDSPERYTAHYYRNDKALTPDNWGKEIEWIKDWTSARIRNVYDSLSIQFQLGELIPLEVTTSTEDTNLILLNSIMVHYSSFDGKWPVRRPLSLSIDDSANGYSLKHWEIKTIYGAETSEMISYAGNVINLTNHITKNKSKILVRAVLEKLPSDIEPGKKQKTMNCKLLVSPKIVKKELIINVSGFVKGTLDIELFDISGKVIKTCKIEPGYSRLNLSGLSSKVLILSVRNGVTKQSFKLLL
jgi:hypothetical protein